jgi:hypothetical protein
MDPTYTLMPIPAQPPRHLRVAPVDKTRFFAYDSRELAIYAFFFDLRWTPGQQGQCAFLRWKMESRDVSSDQNKWVEEECDHPREDPDNVYEAPNYVFGKYGTNFCPAGYIKITRDKVCLHAAQQLGIFVTLTQGDWSDQIVTDSGKPEGCVKDNQNRVTYNNAATGSASPHHMPICAKDTYAISSDSTDMCPDGYTITSSSAMCADAATQLGFSTGSDKMDTSVPDGCIVISGSTVVYNAIAEATGTAAADHAKLCVKVEKVFGEAACRVARLEMNHTYAVRVKELCWDPNADGEYTYLDPYVTTLIASETPTEPDNLTVSNETAYTFLLEWDPSPTPGDCYFTGWIVEVRENFTYPNITCDNSTCTW